MQCQGNPKDGISNCCSEVFLPLNKAQQKSIEEERSWTVDANFTDFKWLKYHKAFNVINTGNRGERLIQIKEGYDYEFKKHPFLPAHTFLYVQDKCSMLLSDGRCKVFRNRPEICKKAECIVFNERPVINWYGKNGLLADKVKDYEEGRLNKW